MPDKTLNASPRTADCEVLVVGAGPVGLMAASLLRRRGIDVRVVDKRAQASRESRAHVIQARSLELFQKMGLVDDFLAQGVVNHGVDMYAGGSYLGGLDFDRAASPDTPYPFIFMLPQARTEAILTRDLTRLGLEVERQVAVTGLTQDGHGVSVRASVADGSERVFRSQYVVGADGAHSAVRKALGLSFEGGKFQKSFLLADCRVNWALSHSRLSVFMNGDITGLFLPIDGATQSRIMVTDAVVTNTAGQGRRDGVDESSEVDIGALEAAFAKATSRDVTLSDVVWTSRYGVHHRTVNRYRQGRVFVAGDAAHIHSPVGGQGMNTGLQDAANLAWKLANALRDGAPDALLNTYDAERRPVGEQVVASTDTVLQTVMGRDGIGAKVRDWLARPAAAAMTNVTPIQRRAFRQIAEIDLGYAGDFLTDDAPTLAGPSAGARAPNAAVTRRMDVFDYIEGYGFTVLALSHRSLGRDEARRVADALETLAGDNVTAHLIARSAAAQDPHVAFVSSTEVFKTYGLTGLEESAIYLVRPDGYIAWRGAGLDVEACRRVLGRFGLGRVAETVAA